MLTKLTPINVIGDASLTIKEFAVEKKCWNLTFLNIIGEPNFDEFVLPWTLVICTIVCCVSLPSNIKDSISIGAPK